MTLDQLSAWQGVDGYLSTFLAGAQLNLWILNGEHPSRLGELLENGHTPVSYTHLRAHETKANLVCRLLLEKKKKKNKKTKTKKKRTKKQNKKKNNKKKK